MDKVLNSGQRVEKVATKLRNIHAKFMYFINFNHTSIIPRMLLRLSETSSMTMTNPTYLFLEEI